MVGIYHKVRQLLNIVQKYAPILSNIAPGLGEAVGTIADLAEGVTDGANNVYEDYNTSKKANKSYCFTDGVKSFVRQPRKVGALERLTKNYGGLHPRIKLKDEM
jgi:hypothetical protein